MESSRKKNQNKTPKSTRKISGYLLYSNEKRQELALEGEKITITELGKQWSALPEKTKKKFNQNAEKINLGIATKQESNEESDESLSDSSDNNSIHKNKGNKANGSDYSQKEENRKLDVVQGSDFLGSNRRFKDEKIEKYFSENDQKKYLRSGSNKKKIITDDDSRLGSDSEINDDQQTEKFEATNKNKENDSNEASKKDTNKNSETNKASLRNKTADNNKSKSIKIEENQESDDEKGEELKSDKITKSKEMQDGMLYKKDRSGSEPKRIRLCAEICASWGFATKLTSFTKLADELNKDFDINFTVKPLGGTRKEFYIYYGNEDDQKLSLVFSNRASFKEPGTIIDKNLTESIIKNIAEFVRSDMN